MLVRKTRQFKREDLSLSHSLSHSLDVFSVFRRVGWLRNSKCLYVPTLHVSNIKESEGGVGGRGRERVGARETEKEGESRRAETEVVVGGGEENG